MRYSATAVVCLLSAACVSARAVEPLKKRVSGARESTPSGCLTVKASGASSGEYSSLSSAVASLGTGSSSESACIFMYSGTYSEQVKINTYKGKLTVYGYTSK